jgi:transcriptional regulator with XRE-family HTH domain
MAGELAAHMGRRIRARRNELGLNQRELSDLIPSPTVNNQYVSNWERGVRPSDDHLELLAEALEVDPSYFLDGREDDAPSMAERLRRLEQQQEEALRQQQEILERLSGGGAVLSAEQWALLERWLAALEHAQPPRASENSPEGGERAA